MAGRNLANVPDLLNREAALKLRRAGEPADAGNLPLLTLAEWGLEKGLGATSATERQDLEEALAHLRARLARNPKATAAAMALLFKEETGGYALNPTEFRKLNPEQGASRVLSLIGDRLRASLDGFPSGPQGLSPPPM